jgi:hypothetical protein
MADDPKPATATPPPTRLVRSKDFRVAFANTFRFRTGAADVGIAFGYQTELPSPIAGGTDQNLIIDEVEIVLTPVMLKLLHLAIADNIEVIETSAGKPIDVPQAILDALAEQRAKIRQELAAQINASRAE